MCRLLKVGRRRHFEWVRGRAATPSAAEQRRQELTGKIVEVHKAADGPSSGLWAGQPGRTQLPGPRWS